MRLSELSDRAKMALISPPRRIHTLVPELDSLFGGGLEMGTMVVVGGTPGSGKTSLAVNLSISIASQLQYEHVAYFSREISADRLFRCNILPAVCGVSKISEWPYGADCVSSLPIDVIDGNISGKIVQEYVDTHEKTALIVIDYVQILDHEDRRLARKDRIAENMTALADIARRSKISIIVLAQLNRPATPIRKSKDEPEFLEERPTLHRFADASDIECWAPIAIGIWQKSQKYRSICVMKNRDGETGEVSCEFDHCKRFISPGMDPDHYWGITSVLHKWKTESECEF